MIPLIGQGEQLNVVTVPRLLWATNGKGRKIFIECFGLTDQVQAQKDAMVLSHVMRERVFGTADSKEGEPNVRMAKL